MNVDNRPLSPHLQIYRPQLTSVMSISHRATGIVLALGLVALTYWLMAAASGPAAFSTAQAVFGSIIGRLLMFVWSYCLFYHLCNGVRHLIWDTGHALDLDDVYTSGYVAIIASVVLTLVTWILVAIF